MFSEPIVYWSICLSNVVLVADLTCYFVDYIAVCTLSTSYDRACSADSTPLAGARRLVMWTRRCQYVLQLLPGCGHDINGQITLFYSSSYLCCAALTNVRYFHTDRLLLVLWNFAVFVAFFVLVFYLLLDMTVVPIVGE